MPETFMLSSQMLLLKLVRCAKNYCLPIGQFVKN